MKLTKTLSTAALAAAMLLCPMGSQAAKPGDFTVGKGTFLLDGKPFVVKAAELHYPRIPKAYWDQRIKMCKALGMNTICMYVFWNIHEWWLLKTTYIKMRESYPYFMERVKIF